MIGFALILVTDKTLTKGLKFFVLALVLLMAAIATAETKYNQILQLPKVILLDSSKSQQPYYLLELSKTNAVLLQQDKNGTNRFKIVDLNQIDTIFESE